MKIPLAGVPEPTTPDRTFTPLNDTTFDKVGAARARLGDTIQGVATDLPVRIKVALDQATIAKAETSAETQFQSFADSLKDGKNPENNDPSTFGQRWSDAQQNFVQQQGEDSGVKSLSPQAQLEYKTMMSKWSAMTSQQVGHLATEKALVNGVGDTNTAYEAKLLVGDTAGAQQTVQKAMDTGLLSPELGKQMIYQIPMKSEYNQAVQMMSRDYKSGGGPIVLEDALGKQNADGSFVNYPHVVGQQRESLMFDAFRNARMLESKVAQKYATMQASGQQPDQNEVAQDLRLGAIAPSAAKALMKPERTFDPGAFADLSTQISQFDPRDDPKHDKEADIWGKLNEAHNDLSPPAADRLQSLFKAKLDPKSPMNTEPVRTVLKANEDLFNRGGYGNFEITHEPTTEEKKADPDAKPSKRFLPGVQTSAQIKRAQVDQKVADYVNSHPGSENDENALMKVYADASKTARGSAGVNLFQPPSLAPSAP